MQKREYEFDWRFIGDMERGRPNLGNMTRVEVYRLFQYTLRDILERDYGTPEADRLLREAGVLAGRAFAERFIGPCTDFGAFVAKVKDALEALRIGILRIEKADVTRLDFILTVAEDLDCSGLPDVGHVVCAYDEGFVAGLFTFFMGRPC
ncbi:MAG TPA: 4-vinyl reductase, partial [Candidatus Bilophila faecipullorum]|nr:4-vinyl reductase [Candidatus Bilophila faecipullorum]